jgi:hypothetical protein
VVEEHAFIFGGVELGETLLPCVEQLPFVFEAL